MTTEIHCQDGVYTFETLKTLHKKCEEKLKGKCQWEHMTRFQVLKEWVNIVCPKCQNYMGIKLKGK